MKKVALEQRVIPIGQACSKNPATPIRWNTLQVKVWFDKLLLASDIHGYIGNYLYTKVHISSCSDFVTFSNASARLIYMRCLNG